jgi:hypothetical protein
MSLPFILHVAIGLLFIYLILSLLASELQELLTTLLQWRAKHLRDSIEILLAGGGTSGDEDKIIQLVDDLYSNPLLKTVNQQAKGVVPTAVRQLTRWIPSNRKGAYGYNQSTGPSYLAPETFATSLMDSLKIGVMADTLTEIRLGKFVRRIVGKYTSKDDGTQEIPGDDDLTDNWERGGIRVLAEKVGAKNLNTDDKFKTLVDDYDDVLKDYQTGRADLSTCIDRLCRNLKSYIDGIAATDAYLNLEPKSKEYLVRRLELYKLGLFGEDNKQAIQSGGLKPNAFELAEIFNQSSKTYKEIADSYAAIQDKGAAIMEKVNANVDRQLEAYNRELDKPATLDSLSNEQRRLFINKAFADLTEIGELTDADRRIYDNYETFQSIQAAIKRVPAPVRDTLEILAQRAHSKVDEAGNYVQQFREEVATWFDRSMSRASGVYKRNAKGVAIILGLVLAIITNSDSFFIADRLSNDENLRKVVTDRATQVNPNNAGKLTEQDLEQLKAEANAALQDLSLPVGWEPANLIRQFRCNTLPSAPTLAPSPENQAPNAPAQSPPPELSRAQERDDLRQACGLNGADTSLPAPVQLLFAKPGEFLRRFMGWLITGIAISMGAPFWFDLLSKLMNVRNSGSKPPSQEGNT